MEIEEARKRKGEAEAEIRGIIMKYREDTDTNVNKIILMKQDRTGFTYPKIIKVIMEVEL